MNRKVSTAATVTQESVLQRRPAGMRPTVPVFEHQEYALGTVCAAVPVADGGLAGGIAISLPIGQADRLAQPERRPRSRTGALLGGLDLDRAFTIQARIHY